MRLIAGNRKATARRATLHDPDATRAMFWDRLDDISVAMLGLTDDMRLVPMSHYSDRDEAALWFITARGTELAEAVATGPVPALHVVGDGGMGLSARIEGRLSRISDKAKLDELWNAVTSSWFEEGRQDDDVHLMRLDPSSAKVWITGGSASFLYKIAKSKVTGETPDLGEHLRLDF
ncbi:pyridoxamine 5'-phosphate oxidase family protein [Paracoccus sp. EGI L200073]|nr:pyridoxamine 5'-phosphate oxidase family protein [Paracoccus salsus]